MSEKRHTFRAFGVPDAGDDAGGGGMASINKMTRYLTQKINGISASIGSIPRIAFYESKPYLR